MTKKVAESGAVYLNKMLYRQYNLTISHDKAVRMVENLLYDIKGRAYNAEQAKHFIDAALKQYYATTQLPEEEYTNHSAYWYNCFLKKYYYIIPIKKNLFWESCICFSINYITAQKNEMYLYLLYSSQARIS